MFFDLDPETQKINSLLFFINLLVTPEDAPIEIREKATRILLVSLTSLFKTHDEINPYFIKLIDVFIGHRAVLFLTHDIKITEEYLFYDDDISAGFGRIPSRLPVYSIDFLRNMVFLILLYGKKEGLDIPEKRHLDRRKKTLLHICVDFFSEKDIFSRWLDHQQVRVEKRGGMLRILTRIKMNIFFFKMLYIVKKKTGIIPGSPADQIFSRWESIEKLWKSPGFFANPDLLFEESLEGPVDYVRNIRYLVLDMIGLGAIKTRKGVDILNILGGKPRMITLAGVLYNPRGEVKTFKTFKEKKPIEFSGEEMWAMAVEAFRKVSPKSAQELYSMITNTGHKTISDLVECAGDVHTCMICLGAFAGEKNTIGVCTNSEKHRMCKKCHLVFLNKVFVVASISKTCPTCRSLIKY